MVYALAISPCIIISLGADSSSSCEKTGKVVKKKSSSKNLEKQLLTSKL